MEDIKGKIKEEGEEEEVREKGVKGKERLRKRSRRPRKRSGKGDQVISY